MKVFSGISSVAGKFKKPVVAIGVFDGVHRGHQALISAAVRQARKTHVRAVVMTFDPHPQHVLRPEDPLPLLGTLDYRIQLLSGLGVDAVVIIRFTKSFSRLSAQQFIDRYLVGPLAPSQVIVGDDFRFGQGRMGSVEVFQKVGRENHFRVISLKTKTGARKTLSSTAAREAILSGDLNGASKILGRPFSLYGRVVSGDGRGAKLGFPTANLSLSGEILPPSGVYCVRAGIRGRHYPGMANIGMRPSFRRRSPVSVEAHLFDFDRTIYGEHLLVEFLHKIREEHCFSTQEDLIAQLEKDERFTRQWFRNRRNG